MANVLLINPSYKSSYGGSKATIVNPVYPTLGLATIAALPKSQGHKIEILDLSYREYDYKLIRERIIKGKIDIVGITATTPLFNQARDISYLVKDISKDIIVVCGGAHASSFPYVSMYESKFDAVFAGEADLTFARLCNGDELKTIPGLYIRHGDGIISTGPAEQISNLDDLPFPAWDLYDLDIYEKNLSRLYVKQVPATKIEFSRGCVYRCNFCVSNKTLTRIYRKKSPERCAEEMLYAKKIGYKEMLLSDDIFTTDNKWATNVAQSLIDKNVNMGWSCSNGIRVESANLEMFKKLKESGCYRVFYGFETGSDEILKNFGKGGKASIEVGRQAVIKAKQAGLDVGGYFMLGLIGETTENVKETIKFANSLSLDLVKFSITTPFPGSELFNHYHRKGMIRSYDWDEYHMASEEQLFAHENLSYQEIQDVMKNIYNETIFMNPKFYYNRIKRSIKQRELLNDIYYYIKFILMPTIGHKVTNNYYAKERWSKFNFSAADKVF